jgi:hypothetical protein
MVFIGWIDSVLSAIQSSRPYSSSKIGPIRASQFIFTILRQGYGWHSRGERGFGSHFLATKDHIARKESSEFLELFVATARLSTAKNIFSRSTLAVPCMSSSPTGIDALAAVAKAAGVTKVYWIDDQFSEAGAQLTSKIRAKVTGLAANNLKPAHSALKDLEFSGIVADDNQKIDAVLKGKMGLGHEILQALDIQIRDSSPGDPVFTDLSAAQVNLIAKCFSSVERFSFHDWLSKKDSLLKSSDETVLFLIDHDFSLEDGCGTTQGEDILKPLISDTAQRCFYILFSHNVTLGTEHSQRKAIATSMGVPEYSHRFSIVGKGHIRIPATDGEAPLVIAFQDSFIRRWCHMMVNTTQEVLTKAVGDTKTELMSLTFEEISAAFFRKSCDEGTSEFDVLVRVMMLAGRVAIEDMFCDIALGVAHAIQGQKIKLHHFHFPMLIWLVGIL